ncbi:MAG: BatA and WFA domain-containing protein [Opitutales bacterium]|nr:BatA and WFA domain-containing protein [Opitutales bacterium]
MNIFFTNAMLWPLLFFIALPLVVHLVARTRPRVRPFSSLFLLRPVARQTRRWRRPQEWLILLIRTVAVICLVLLFLRPLLFQDEPRESSGESRQVVVLVDASASMGYLEGSQTRFNRAVGEASAVLDGLRSADQVNVILAGRRPRAVLPEAGSNHDYLKAALREAQVTRERLDVDRALRLVREEGLEREGSLELVVVSDFQASAWEEFDGRLLSGWEVVWLPVAREPADNTAVLDVRVEPSHPLAGEVVTVYAELGNFSAEPRRLEVQLAAGELRQSQDLDLPAGERQMAIFTFVPPESEGEQLVTVEIGEDAFPGDNRRDAVFTLRPQVEVSLRTEEEVATGRYWRHALEALEWVKVREWREGNGGEVSIFWDAAAGERPESRVVIWTPEAGESWAGGDFRRERMREEQTLQVQEAEHPLFQVFEDGAYGNPARGVFTERWRPGDERWADDWRVLLSYADGVPALAYREENQQTFYFWNLTLAPEGSNFATQPEYLTLLAELVFRHRHEKKDTEGSFPLSPGEPAQRVFPEALGMSPIHLRGPDEEQIPVERSEEESGIVLRSEELSRPGAYRWEQQERVIGYEVVQFPSSESDLRTLPTEALRSDWGGTAVARGQRVRELQEGREIWPWFLFGVIGFLLAEGALLYRTRNRRLLVSPRMKKGGDA